MLARAASARDSSPGPRRKPPRARRRRLRERRGWRSERFLRFSGHLIARGAVRIPVEFGEDRTSSARSGRRGGRPGAAMRFQTSVAAGTFTHRSHVPPKDWFRAMLLTAGRSNGISALQLKNKFNLKALDPPLAAAAPTAGTGRQRSRNQPGRDIGTGQAADNAGSFRADVAIPGIGIRVEGWLCCGLCRICNSRGPSVSQRRQVCMAAAWPRADADAV